MRTTQINLDNIPVAVTFKNIKNIHLSVNPPDGEVRVSAPKHLKLDNIRVFLISKLDWIRKQIAKLQDQDRETPREFLERESHYAWGKRYLLSIKEREQAPSVRLEHSRMVLTVRPGADLDKKRAVVEEWYRDQIKKVAQPLIAKWENIMGVKVEKLYVRRMKTKWGSCNIRKRTIRLNTNLAKNPPECLEYIIVHEMTHLLEPSHNGKFKGLMDKFMPKWSHYRDMLNRLPVRHEEWSVTG
jgi:predicted metal-dependent hydrolase